MLIYELRDEEASALSFHATVKDAREAQKWWAKEGGTETTIHPLTLEKVTRASVVNLLNRIARTSL